MRRSLLFLTFCCFVAPFGLLQAAEIKLGAVAKAPPFFYEENGKTMGIDYEIYLELKKRMGFDAILYPLPFRRLWLMIQRGELDGTIQIYYSAKREGVIMYSDPPMHWSAHHIFVRSEDLASYSSYGLEALTGKKVGKNSGFFITKEFVQAVKDGKFSLEEVKTTYSNLKKLHTGRIDCFVGNIHAILMEIKQAGLQGEIVPFPEPFAAKKGTYFALAKNGTGISDKQSFLLRVNEVLAEIHSDGTLERITAKYLE